MKNEIAIFNYEEKELRTIQIDGEVWFVLKDVCKVLGIGDARRVAERLDGDEWSLTPLTDTLGRQQKTYIVNESGVYNVILRSDKTEAVNFKRWLTHEVIPSIRKHGGYVTKEKIAELIYNPDTMIHWLTELKKAQEKNGELQDEISVLKPKADYHDLILQSKSAVPITQIAKDYGYSAKAFNELLHDLRIQYSVGKTWVLYQEFADCGYTKSKTFHIGEEKTATHTYWLPAGVLFLYHALREIGIVPITERNSAIDGNADYPF